MTGLEQKRYEKRYDMCMRAGGEYLNKKSVHFHLCSKLKNLLNTIKYANVCLLYKTVYDLICPLLRQFINVRHRDIDLYLYIDMNIDSQDIDLQEVQQGDTVSSHLEKVL